MPESEFLRTIRPRNNGNLHKEAFSFYFHRVRRLIPNVPESVAEQWLHRHFDDFVFGYGWLSIRDVQFRHGIWETDRYLEDVDTYDGHDVLEVDERALIEAGPFWWLAEYMINNETWPAPVIVLENPDGLVDPEGWALHQPFHLLEGHHRVGYLRALEKDERWSAAPRHELWIGRVDVGRVHNTAIDPSGWWRDDDY